ncbi:hypothetical protein F5Y12DRAFT_717812 [Xylaria sp. FL1777]|nr:hypothetical protein F5Y12DRAFT_717812 [Xylaria sp. FL1777]
MEFPFEVIEHILPAQRLREWSRAAGNSQEAVLRIHIKQYRPKDNPNPQPGDVTIIGAHGMHFPKKSTSQYTSQYEYSIAVQLPLVEASPWGLVQFHPRQQLVRNCARACDDFTSTRATP